VLDGGWCLAAAAAVALVQLVDLVRSGFPPLLLVGIDYPEGRPGSRSRDYTMADAVPDDPMIDAMKAHPLTAPGGADRFLAFIEGELDPLIRARYPVAGKTAGIIGDSFGGTFTFYAFLKQSRLFDRYWLGSPGLFTTGTDYIAQAEAMLAGPLVHDTRMYLSCGELEAAGGVELYEDMGRNYSRLVDVISRRAHPQLAHHAKIYAGHTHATIVMPAMNDALLYLYGPHFPG
jgi:predicted alpha/beta superfamily hydrolase